MFVANYFQHVAQVACTLAHSIQIMCSDAIDTHGKMPNLPLQVMPTAWNSLPVNICAETSQVKFKKLLKLIF